jgi:hypothetical protein
LPLKAGESFLGARENFKYAVQPGKFEHRFDLGLQPAKFEIPVSGTGIFESRDEGAQTR